MSFKGSAFPTLRLIRKTNPGGAEYSNVFSLPKFPLRLRNFVQNLHEWSQPRLPEGPNPVDFVRLCPKV